MAILCGWDFIGKGGQSNVPPARSEAGVSGTTGIGSGLLPFNYLGNGLTGRKQTKTTLNDALADNEYVSFTITPQSGISITINEIRLRPVSQNRARKFSLFSNRKPFTAGNEIKTFQEAQVFLQLTSIPTPGISGVTTPVEFRLYIYGHTDEWESVGIGERQAGSSELLDLEVIGVVGRQSIQPPTNLAASNITSSGFTLSWSAPAGATSYEVFANGTSRGTTASTSMALTGLAAGTYSMTVRARNAVSVSAPSTALSVIIGQIQPPTNLAASNITASGFTLNWTASAGATSYEVFANGTSRGTTASTSMALTGLAAGTHSMTVRARNAAGNVSVPSTALSVIIGQIQPPTNLAASNVTSTGFTLSWTASAGATSYEVFANGTSRGTTASTSMALTGLAAGTYSMTATARNATGTSPASSPLSVIIGREYPNSRSRMGINLSSVNEYTTDQPLKDLFKTARPWNDGNIASMQLDVNGWITSMGSVPQAIAYVMLSETPAEVYEMGQYVLLYEGAGTISFEGAGVTRVSTAPGRIVYNVSPQPGNRWISITAVTPGNHIRNIRLLPAIYENDYQSNPWRPYHLSLWSRFKVIRFMDWMATNNSTQVRWEQRTTTSWYTYNDRSGVPIELIADLCNRLHTDAWICVPHQANDDYVAQLARLLRSTLAPDLKVHVEYSNECWNYMFTQAGYCLNNGRTTYPNINNDYERHIRWYSRRCVQIYDIFEREFGDTSRLVRVLGGQQGNSWGLQVMFEHENARNKVDAFAIAPYFGHEYACDRHQQVISWTLPQFFNDIRNSALPTAWRGEEECMNYARSVNKPLLAYEGGQHFTGGACNGIDTANIDALNRKFIDANLSTEMGAVYTTDLNHWRSMGGGLYCAFASMTEYTRWGSWGLLRYPKQDPATAPKYQAILNWISNNPA